MGNPSSKQQQLNLRLIYTALAIGFALLLILIWAIGTLSTSKLDQISIIAGESATDYKERLTLALNIREAAAEVVAELRVYRAGRDLRVPAPPFRQELKDAKERFRREIDNGKKLWGKREEYKTLPLEELKAWREVETAAQRFWDKLVKVEELTRADKPADNSDPNTPQQNARSGQDGLFDLRKELDTAAEKLSTAVTQVQDQILNQIVNQQKAAASDVSGARWGTLLLGLLVATLTFIIARSQITQLRQANRLEQEAKDFARSIFDSQSNDIIVVNREGELLAVNQAFLDHFQLPAPSLVLQDYAAALAHLPEVAAFVRKTLEDTDDDAGYRERIEVKPRYDPDSPTADAGARLFDVYISPLTIGGQPGGRVIVLVDVTEAESVREELRRSRTLSAVGQITATVAHELYNPIGAVKLNIDLLEMQISGDDDVKHTLARLKRGVEHLSTIVMDLRYLTRPREPERKPTDLNKLLEEVVELAGDRLERSRVFVARKYSSWLPHGQFDPQQLRKVFLNLLINAVEASPQNSDVELHTHYLSANGASPLAEVNGKRGAVVISIIDHGVGMSPETKRRLFEAFYTTKRNGTGLGMMITQEIVKKHGGKIEVESEEGKGTTVSVYLPV
jgi:signal transduction histidine kinase